jgi:hypothetical protein
MIATAIPPAMMVCAASRSPGFQVELPGGITEAPVWTSKISGLNSGLN